MSLNVPSFRFLLGMETNRPFGPLMTLMSVTTKQWSKTTDTNALSFSSSTGMTLTSVISMLTAPLDPRRPPSANPRPAPCRPVLVEGQRPRHESPEALTGQRRAGPLGRARPLEQPEVARAAPGKGSEAPAPLQDNGSYAPSLLAQDGRLLQCRLLEVVHQEPESAGTIHHP